MIFLLFLLSCTDNPKLTVCFIACTSEAGGCFVLNWHLRHNKPEFVSLQVASPTQQTSVCKFATVSWLVVCYWLLFCFLLEHMTNANLTSHFTVLLFDDAIYFWKIEDLTGPNECMVLMMSEYSWLFCSRIVHFAFEECLSAGNILIKSLFPSMY